MDRSILEGDPHSVIEGMAIAGYAIGSSQGYAYIRAEYPLAVERFGKALVQAREYGLLGKNILGTGFDFDVEIRMGSGAFVCGEETALMTSIEGKRGEPRPRPPFPAVKGLWGKPSLLNNVETYSNVPLILTKGADWYAAIGSAKSKGTKVFALAGKVNNTGLVEVPIGTPLGEIIYDIGGGIPGGKKFKAAQMGGPSGGCIPKEHLNVPVDYETLTELGAIMGSGGLIVMDEDSCMVDVARFFLDFVQDESCGKCVPCRIGTKRMLEIVNRICEGQGQESDIERLIDLGGKIKDTALCGLGQTAPNPVLSTIRHFRDEYVAHIRDKRCPAGVCPALVRAPCQNACPAAVDVPGFVSLIGEKRYSEALGLHRERNPFASVCARVCFHTCEDKCRRSTLDEPLSIRGLKRYLVEQEVTIQLPEIRDDEKNAKRKIAIVGAGPAGLSCAYFLARMGYRPNVFEAEQRPGGMLVQTIPAYRLPREELAREVRMIERLGVDIQTGMRLGKDFTLTSLRNEGYEAVFLGVGAPQGTNLGVPGEELEGVTDAIGFLREYNIRGSAHVGRKVAVVGGGNAAVDAARTAIRLGAESATILYRRSRDEMPAYAEEIDEAEHEGVVLKVLAAPVEILGKDGHVAGVKCSAMVLGDFDRSGRRRPIEMSSGEFVEEADQVIVAIGQAVDAGSLTDGVDLKLTRNKFIEINPVNGQTSVPWIFAGGDAATRPVVGGRGGRQRRERRRRDGRDAHRREARVLARRARRRDGVRPGGRPGAVPARADAVDPRRPPPAELQRGGAAVRPAGRAARGEAVPAMRLPGQRIQESCGMPSLTIDQHRGRSPGRDDSPRRRAQGGHHGADAVLPGERPGDRRVPRLRRRGRGRQDARRLVRGAGGERDEGANQFAPRPRGAPHGRRDASLRPRRRLPDLRPQRELRAPVARARARHPPGDLRRRQEPQDRGFQHARAQARHVEVRALPALRHRLQRDPGRRRAAAAVPRVQDRRRSGVLQRAEGCGLRAVRPVRRGLPGRRDH